MPIAHSPNSLVSVVKASTGSPVDTPDWKKKYFDSLTSLEDEQRKFRAMEAALKRLTGRLCIASLGQSPKLDDEIKALQTAIRREAGSDELDKIAAALTDTIQTLDRPALAAPAPAPQANKSPAESREAIAGDERVRAVLAALLAELRRDPDLLIQVDALDARLAASLTREQLPEVLASLSELVSKRIQRIERAKQEMEVLLNHMVGKLDEIGHFVSDQNQNQSKSRESSETLNIQLVGEMKAMGESVESAADLSQIRSQVRNRIDTIGRHLQEFRQRETDLATAMNVRTEQMQARVAELESEAKKLQTQLQDEQRQSTIDTLTKVNNRLAYEKRIDEELQRWQRFKQPTCIAVWDVDRFKSINDTYGHRAGDGVLRAVADCLMRQIRSTDFLARYGGEEFVMILCGTQLADAMRLMDKIRIGVSELKLHSRGTPLAITISSGVTALMVDDTSASAFDRADKALYRAKETGRNRCVSG
jgi:diguanylate cyclase